MCDLASFQLAVFFRKRKRLLKKCIDTEEMIYTDYMLASGVSFCVFQRLHDFY